MPTGVYERSPSEKERLRAMMHEFGTSAGSEANLNWAGDPCRACGKYPLSVFNTSGLCKKCRRENNRR